MTEVTPFLTSSFCVIEGSVVCVEVWVADLLDCVVVVVFLGLVTDVAGELIPPKSTVVMDNDF